MNCFYISFWCCFCLFLILADMVVMYNNCMEDSSMSTLHTLQKNLLFPLKKKKKNKIWNEVSKWWQKYWYFWLNHAFIKMIAETQNTVSSHFILVIHVSPNFTIIYLAVIYFSGKIMPFCLIFGNDILFVPCLS